MPPRKNYSDEFKNQVIIECHETGNASLVARKHNIHVNTVNNWLKLFRQTGSVTKSIEDVDNGDLKEQLYQVSQENDRLKRLIAEKELKISIMEDLMKKGNPRMPTKSR